MAKEKNRTKNISELPLQIFEKVEAWGGMLLFIFLIGMLSVDIFSRYVLNRPLPTRDLCLLSFTWLTFLGISLTYRRKGHPKVSFLTRLLPQYILSLLKLFINFFIGFFLVFLLIYTIKWQKTQVKYTTIELQIPLILFSLSIVVSGISMLISIAYNLLREIKQITKKN